MVDTKFMIGTALGMVAFVSLSLWGIFSLIEGDAEERRERWSYHTTKFYSGTVVNIKAFGHKGVVINFSCHQNYIACRYGVRVSAITSSTPDRLFGSGGAVDVAPMSIIDGVREFELELYTE